MPGYYGIGVIGDMFIFGFFPEYNLLPACCLIIDPDFFPAPGICDESDISGIRTDFYLLEELFLF